MTNEILVFTHTDADALGCMLSAKKGLPKQNFKYWHTNYQNIPELTDEIVRYQAQNNNNYIFIMDISFSNNKKELLELCNTGAQILFIDHHLYSSDYFSDLPKNIKVIHDVNNSATMLAYKYFLKTEQPEKFNKLIDLIDVYDIWQKNRPEFLAAQYFNEYFWKNASNMSLENLMYKIINSDWKLPDDFSDTVKQIAQEIQETKESLEKRKLIYRTKDITIMFTDKYFNWVIQDEFKDGRQVCIIINDWGLVRIRISEDSILSKGQKDKLRLTFTGSKDIGHDNAFTYKMTNPASFENIMKEVELVSTRIQGEINDN